MSRILLVASEGLPFIKSGGLADVIGSLPYEFKKKVMMYVLLCLCIRKLLLTGMINSYI